MMICERWSGTIPEVYTTQERRQTMISPEFRQHIIDFLNTPDEVHIRRIVATYKEKFPAMASICAITHCEMEEAYKIYDQYKQQLESERNEASD